MIVKEFDPTNNKWVLVSITKVSAYGQLSVYYAPTP